MSEKIVKTFFGLNTHVVVTCEICGATEPPYDLIFKGFQIERGKTERIWFCDPCLAKKFLELFKR